MTVQEKLARVLRTDRDNILKVEQRLSTVTGKRGVLEEIAEENERLMRDRLVELGVQRKAHAREVYDALILRIEADDRKLVEKFGNPDWRKSEECQKIANAAVQLAVPPKGFFIKEERAREFLLREPPRRVMEYLRYRSVEDMLAREDLFEVYSALRIVEGNEWLNAVFFKQYESLTPDDFEEREIRVRALGEQWGDVSRQFARKKWHNISHLKEMGVVFVMPILLGISGELLRMFALILHYLYEVPFYSSIIKRLARGDDAFAENVISLLRGDVLDRRLPENDKTHWLVVQRYLAKDDEYDWRLFVPRINPETLHWARAEGALAAGECPFWCGLGWVGDHFKDESGVEVLVSFNFIDTVMALVKEKEMLKYIYHHQEALWNRIFAGYFGQDSLDEYAKKYLLQGYFSI